MPGSYVEINERFAKLMDSGILSVALSTLTLFLEHHYGTNILANLNVQY